MSLTPRKTLDDAILDSLRCAICENPNLTIVRVETYPDFITCDRCGSAFVVENEGDWVMYGKVPAEYPETSQFALKKWTWLDAVAQRALDEREEKSAVQGETQSPSVQVEEKPETVKPGTAPFVEETPAPQTTEKAATSPPDPGVTQEDPVIVLEKKPPFPDDVQITEDEVPEVSLVEEPVETQSVAKPEIEEIFIPPPVEPIKATESIQEVQHQTKAVEEILPPAQDIGDEAPVELRSKIPPAAIPVAAEVAVEMEAAGPIAQEDQPSTPPSEVKAAPSSVPVGEPEPDNRFQTTVRGSSVKYPHNCCSHCLRTPVKLKSIMRGSLPDPNHLGKRKLVPLALPFCRDCQQRMQAQNDDEKNARLLAFLVSGLIALVLVLLTLILGRSLFENIAVGVIVMLAVGVLGFSIPFFFLLERSKRFPPPRDAAFVLSTLLVNDAGEDLTQFEWRNRGYAELFRQVNRETVVGEIESVEDRATFTDLQPSEVPDETSESMVQQDPVEPIAEDTPSQ